MCNIRVKRTCGKVCVTRIGCYTNSITGGSNRYYMNSKKKTADSVGTRKNLSFDGKDHAFIKRSAKKSEYKSMAAFVMAAVREKMRA